MDSSPFSPVDVTVTVDEGSARYRRIDPLNTHLAVQYVMDARRRRHDGLTAPQIAASFYNGDTAVHVHILNKLRRRLIALLPYDGVLYTADEQVIEPCDATHAWTLTDKELVVQGRSFEFTREGSLPHPRITDGAVVRQEFPRLIQSQAAALLAFYQDELVARMLATVGPGPLRQPEA